MDDTALYLHVLPDNNYVCPIVFVVIAGRE